MALQYNLDHGSNLGSFESFVQSQHYTDAFEQALKSANVDITGSPNTVDIQNVDQYGEYFRSGYDAAYVSTYAAADSTDQVALDKAQVIMFETSLDGVDSELSGSVSHFVGLTGGDDSIVIGGGLAQAVDGGAGDDYIATGKGNDRLFGGEGADDIHAGRGNDLVDGGEGNDRLFGDRGDDSIFGGGGEDTIDGGTGFDVATVTGDKADFHYVGHEWVNAATGEHVGNVEYLNTGDGGVLITVQNTSEAEVARLFQAINNQDPTAADYKSALVALHNGSDLATIAKSLVDGLDSKDDLAGTLSNASEKAAFVTTIIHNLYDGSAGEWSAGQINSYVATSTDWDKAKIVADLVHKVADADDHIGIHVDSTTV